MSAHPCHHTVRRNVASPCLQPPSRPCRRGGGADQPGRLSLTPDYSAAAAGPFRGWAFAYNSSTPDNESTVKSSYMYPKGTSTLSVPPLPASPINTHT